MKKKQAQAFGGRLRERMLELGHTSARANSGVDVSKIQKATGVTREMARRYAEGLAFPEPDRMQALADFLMVRVAWLRDGEPPKFPARAAPLQVQEPHPLPYGDSLAEGREFSFVPRLNVLGSVGPGVSAEHETVEDHLAFRTNWLQKKGLKPDALKVIVAHGESMSGTVEDGDVLLVDTSDREIKDGRIYAINYDDFVRVKRLFRRFDGTLVIHSDNPAVKPQEEEVPPDRLQALKLRVIGRVVWRGGDL